MDLIGPSNGLDRCASSTQQQTMGAAPSSECGILLHRFFSEFTLLVGQRLHISHDHHLIRSWGIRHEKRFDVDEVLYQDCVKKLLVWYLVTIPLWTDEPNERASLGTSRVPTRAETPRNVTLYDGSVSWEHWHGTHATTHHLL